MAFTFTKAESHFKVDPLVRALTPKKVENDIAEYRSLLDECASEGRVHEFLASHSYFFNGIIRLYGWSPVYSKVKLGIEYETDFVCFDSGSLGPEWYLIEIEAPNKRLFTMSGVPSAALTHAIEQVRDWHAWVHDNADYARKLMPHIEYPLGYIFMGRRAELTPGTKKKLRRLVHDHRMILRIHTLDWLEWAARGVKDLIRDGKGGNWPVPMHAFTHQDLAKGRPPEARAWLESPYAQREVVFNRGLRRSQREYSYLQTAEYSDD